MKDGILELRRKLGRPLILGHRGAPGGSLDKVGPKVGYAPENTMASFKRGLALGADAVECDVHLSRDGQLMVIHDETLDRTTSGHGLVSDHTAAEMQALDAGSHFGPEFAGEPVPTLEQLLVWAMGERLPVVIEIKPSQHAEAVVEACIDLVDRLKAAEWVTFISFDHFVVRGIKKRRRHWRTGALYVGRVVDPVGVARAALANGLLPNAALLTADLVEAMHAEDMWVGTWTPNTEAELRAAIGTGVDMIGTNHPERLKQLLGQ